MLFLQAFASAFLSALKPEPDLSVSKWADRYRRLSASASAEPGPYRVARTPYMREILDSLSASSTVERVVLMKGAQLGFTEAGGCFVGYVMDSSPVPMLCVQPTISLAERYSRQRIEPMIRETPKLASKVSSKKSRDSSNTVLYKEFAGGVLALAGANSAPGLRSMPICNLFLDEIDAYPMDVDGEGDPIELAERGTRTFARRKILMGSTPTVKGRSRIETAYEQSDQRRFKVPCPHCDHYQDLYWSRDGRRGIVWDEGKPETARYICESCEGEIREGHKTKMLARGRWVAKYPERKTRGYHLNSLYSPVGWFSWQMAVEQFLKARKNPVKLKVWVNQTLGETWEEDGEAPSWERLYRNRETFKQGVVPKGAGLLTAGVDVQKDRLEVQLVAWGPGLESWSIDYSVIPGDPTDPDTWKELDKIIGRQYPHEEDNVMLPVRMTAIDSGYDTQNVYKQVRLRSHHCIAVKGRDNLQSIIGTPRSVDVNRRGKQVKYRGVRLWPVGTDVAKRELYGWLKMDPPLKEGDEYPEGYCHLPQRDEEFFKQLTAERLVTRNHRGYEHQVWEKTRERNEVLDTAIYARAAAAAVGIDRWSDGEWEKVLANFSASDQSDRRQEQKQHAASSKHKSTSGFFARFRV